MPSSVILFLLLLLFICFSSSLSKEAGGGERAPAVPKPKPKKAPPPAIPLRPIVNPILKPVLKPILKPILKPGRPAGPKPAPRPGQVRPSDPDSIYKSFLECLPKKSPQPDPSYHTIVYGSVANSSTYIKTLEEYTRNRRYNVTSTHKPAIIVTPTKEFHVQASVLCAKELDLHMKIRSGGHDYEAISYASSEKRFMILDMFNLRTVDVDIPAETAVVQAGAQLGELYYKIWEKSKVHGFPSGVCPTIGVGGHISGAGYGNMIRKYGLSIDHVIDAKIVNVNGKILDKKAMGEDLFWALRGGGGSSFGVVLSFTLKLVAVPKVVTVFRILKTMEPTTVDTILKWQSVSPTVDNDLFIRLILDTTMVNNKTTARTTFVGFFLGDSNRLMGLMGKAFPELGLKKADCVEVSWLQSLLYWAEMDINKTKPEVLIGRQGGAMYFKRGSDFVQTPIAKPGWTAILNKVATLDKFWMQINPYGGKMSEIPANATAMPHRAGNLFKIQYAMNWEESDPKLAEKYMNEEKAMHEFMTPYVSKNPRGAFTNYRDFNIGVNSGDGFNSGKVYGEKLFKGNFDRLVKVKTAVDPDNFFRNEQSIPTQTKKP